MNNKSKNSEHVLVVAIIAVVSTAFIASLSTVPSAAQQIKATDEVDEKKNNHQYQAISDQHPNLGSHTASDWINIITSSGTCCICILPFSIIPFMRPIGCIRLFRLADKATRANIAAVAKTSADKSSLFNISYY
jgi:hypothetical protein